MPTTYQESIVYLWLTIKEYYYTIINNRELSEYYKYKRDSIIPRSTPTYLMDYIEKYLKPGISILDIGCADGAFLDLFQNKDIKAFGLEYNLERVMRAKELGREVINGDMHLLPYRDNYFEIIIASEILQQSESPKPLIVNWAKKLKNNGVILISLANLKYWKELRKNNIKGRLKSLMYHSQYTKIYEREEFIELLNDAGLNSIKVIDYPSSSDQKFWIALCKK